MSFYTSWSGPVRRPLSLRQQMITPMHPRRYRWPCGQPMNSAMKPSDVEASLVEYLKGEEKRGFNNCAMYKHEFGSLRAFYTTCTFDDIDHFARIMDGSPPATIRKSRSCLAITQTTLC